MTIEHDIMRYESTIKDIIEYSSKGVSLAQVMQGEMSGKFNTDDQMTLDSAQLKYLFQSEDWVFICVDLVASKISSQQLRVMKQTVENGKASVTPAEDHWLQKVIENPNELQDYYSWMYTVAADLCLTGNAPQWYWRGNNKIFPIPVENIGIDFDRDGRITRYVTYSHVDSYGFMQKRPMFSFLPVDVAHIRLPNPSSMVWGMSPFIPGQRVLAFNRWSTEYLNAFYQKGASPGLILQMGDGSNEANALRLLRSIEMSYTGRRNSRRTMIIPKGVTAQVASHTLADQQLKEHIILNRETIISILKIPPHEVGLQKTGSLGSEEYKTALKNFWAASLKPKMRMIAGALSKVWAQELGPDHFLEFDLSDVDILQEDYKTKADIATAMLTSRTLNEVRHTVWNDEPLEGGDALPGSQQQPLYPSFPQFSFNPHQPPPLDKTAETKEFDAEEIAVSPYAEKAERFLKNNNDWFKKREQDIAEVVAESEPKMFQAALDLFAKQYPEIIKIAKEYLTDEKNYEAQRSYFRSDHVGTTKSWVIKAKIKDKEKLKKKVEETLEKTGKKEWGENYNTNLKPALELGYGAGLDIPFAGTSRDELQALKEKDKQRRRLLLKERGLTSFANLNKSTTERAMVIIERAVKENLTIDEIAKKLLADADTKAVGNRARTIARTETLSAVSAGQGAAMKDAAKIIPKLKKMWLNSGDDRVRGYKSTDQFDHITMQGQTVDHDKPFLVSGKFGKEELQYPRAPEGSAANVINCRCTWIMLPEEEMDNVKENELQAAQTPDELAGGL